MQKTGISTSKGVVFLLGHDSEAKFCLWVQLPMYEANHSANVLFLHIRH
jgi:hypothetical protein